MQLFSDGECPICLTTRLSLNKHDLLECPTCGLVCSLANPLVAAVMPFIGSGHFRMEDTRLMAIEGTAFAKCKSNSVLPDYQQIFQDVGELKAYLELLESSGKTTSADRLILKDFLQALRKSFSESGDPALALAWSSKPDRTRFYANDLLPAAASKLKLVHQKEKFTVDHVLLKRSINDHLVPQIYIESENDYERATHEIQKLCSLNTPLRVLITATTKKFLSEPAAGAYKKLREWQSIIRSHKQMNSAFNGVLAVIVGRIEGKRISYDVCAFHSDGDLALPLTTFYDRVVG